MRAMRLVAAGVLCAALAIACGAPPPRTVTATFDDVIDLTVNNAVKIADVTVGSIAAIDLAPDNRALVTMQLDESLVLPSRVSARLRKTSVLGERYVELVPDPDSGGELADGAEITDTAVVPELEELILTSTDLLIAISVDTLAGAIEAGADGLDGRGATLGGIIDDLDVLLETYNANSGDLVRLLDGLDAFLDTVGPNAELHGRALAEATEFARVLAEEDDRLVDTLVEVADLATTGEDIILTHRQRFDDFTVRLNALTDSILAYEADLDILFTELYGHNFHTIRGINNEHAQVVLDFIVCGINDEPGSPVRACENNPRGSPQPVPRPPQDY